MPNALQDGNFFSFAPIAAVAIGDVEKDDAQGHQYMRGGIFFAHAFGGLKILQYVKNTETSTVSQGALLSAVGDTDGKTQITTSGGDSVNTKIKATTSGLTADKHAGGGAHVVNSTAGTGVAPEGEDAPVVANTTTVVNIDPNLPFSATLKSGDLVDLYGLYNAELSADGDLAYAVLGVVLPKDGIGAGKYGFVQKQGRCFNVLVKASTALTQNDALVADAGRVGPAAGTTDIASFHVGTALHVLNSDSVPDKTSAMLTLGLGFNPGTLDASA